MLKRIRKSSSSVTLVLIGAAALTAGLSGCSKEEVRRDVYASKADCLADWGNTPTDCEPAYDRPTGHGGTTHYYGRPYTYSGGSSTSASRSGSSSRAIGSSTTSRGGFGSSGRSSSG
ncbi:MAG: hypothetical protein JNN20_11080 [Betaproteobacteria bacterium]|nr:hypothetical protein [Betaproteobacteria bacterium]